MDDGEVPSTRAPGLGLGRGRRAAQGWSNYQLSRILCIRPTMMGRWRAGEAYPDVRALKKIEAVFGWPAAEQIDLIPMGDLDPRWAMVFNEVLREWMIANPRTLPAGQLQPLVKSRTPGGGRPRKV